MELSAYLAHWIHQSERTLLCLDLLLIISISLSHL